MSNRPARCSEAEIKRALRAVQATGMAMNVEILPDGTIRIAPTVEKSRFKSMPFDEDKVIPLC